MKKKICGLVMTLILSASIVNTAFAGVNIKLDDMLIPVKEIVNKDGYNMVSFTEAFTMLGATIDWNGVKNCITAKFDDESKNVIVYFDSNKAVVNGKTLTLDVEADVLDKDIRVPVKFVAEALDADITWDENTKTINIKRGTQQYLMLDMEDTIDENTIVLSFDEALKLAIDKNSDLKNLDDTITYLDELRDDLSNSVKKLDSVYATYSTLIDAEHSDIDKESAFYLSIQDNIESTVTVMQSMKNTDKQKELKSVNEEMLKDSIELSLKSYISSIKNYKMQISLLEESVALGAENISNMELKNSLGMESDYNLKTAKIQQEQNEANLETLKLTLVNQKQSLKNLLGIDVNTDLVIDAPVTFDKLSGVELEAYITREIQNDPSIKVLKSNVEVANYNKRLAATLSDKDRLKAQSEANEGSRKLKDTQDNMATNIRNAYNKIKQLEQQNAANLLEVKKAIEDYNTVVTSYNEGLVPIYQVKQARMGILNAEMAVEKNALDYDMLVFSFNKPYLLG